MSACTEPIDVITIDGHVASGKGEVSMLVAQQLKFNTLDSGMIYRVIAHRCIQKKIPMRDPSLVMSLLEEQLPTINVRAGRLYVGNRPVGMEIRTQSVDRLTPVIASNPLVREAVVPLQRQFFEPPGLVADGRDMGTAIFPNAALKIFLTANPKVRALRRYRQYQLRGRATTFNTVFEELQKRDKMDETRKDSPLRCAADAHRIETDKLTAPEVAARIIALWDNRNARP